MSRLFTALHSFVWRRPRAAFAVLAALSLLAALAAARIRFSGDIADVLPRNSESVEAVAEVAKHFAFTGQMVVLFERDDPAAGDAAARRLADAVGTRLRAAPGVVAADWKVSAESERFVAALVSDAGPLLLPEDRLPAFLERLRPEGIRAAVRRNRLRLQGAGIGAADVLVERDPLDLTRDFFMKGLSAGRPQGAMDLSDGYFFNEGRTALLMTVEGERQPQDVNFSRALVTRAREAIAAARGEVPEAAGWRVTLFGGYPTALAGEEGIKGDLRINILTSIPPVLLMLLISMRRWASLAIGAAALTLGLLWSFGLAGLVFGHLTGVTVGFAALIAGMGIDFTIHLFHRYRLERAGGATPEAASAAIYGGTVPGAFIAMITTVAAIFCLWVSTFQGLREFGTLVGLGLLLVFAATVLVIPLFLRREPADRPDREIPRAVVTACWALFFVYLAASVRLDTGVGLLIAAACLLLMTGPGARAVVGLVCGRPRLAAVIAAAVTLATLPPLSRPPRGLPSRETDVRNLRPEGDELLAAQERMRAAFRTGADPVLVLVRGAGEGEALEKAAAVTRAMEAEPGVACQSLTTLVPPPAAQARNAAALAAVDPERAVADLDAALDAEGFDPAAFDAARAWLRRLLAARSPVLPSNLHDPFFDSLRKRFLATDPAGAARALVWVTPARALHIRGERDAALDRLRDAARAASPGAVLSGFQLVVREIDDRIGPDIFWACIAGAGASALLAWILFASFRDMAVSIFPAVVGTFWMLAAFKLMDLRMNYVNLIALPVMAGLATDSGLYMVERFRELGRRSSRQALESLWPSLVLTNLTTIVGFGSLAYSANRAMRSLGVAITVGMLCYLFASLLVLPPLLAFLEKRGEAVPPRP